MTSVLRIHLVTEQLYGCRVLSCLLILLVDTYIFVFYFICSHHIN